MRNIYILFWLFFLPSLSIFAQMNDTLSAGTQNVEDQIFKVAEEMPRFPGCEKLLYPPERKSCADNQLLQFIYSNISYPDSARIQGKEGTVVIGFVIEKDGRISNGKIMRDIGGGCGEEALRVINLMNEKDIKWIPGRQNGEPVRVEFNLPIKFRLEEEPDFALIDGDSVFTNIDEPLFFTDGPEALENYIATHLQYPPSGYDSCRVGSIEADALVNPDGLVKAVNIIDFSGLGLDFQFAAIELITETMGKWTPAKLNGRMVPTTYPLRLTFKPDSEECKNVVSQFELAEQLCLEGINLYNKETEAEAIAKLDQAIELFPENGEFLYSRGIMHMNNNDFEKACADLTKSKEILGSASMVNQILPLICKKQE